MPYVNYGVLALGSANKSYLEKKLKLQKWAVRTISNRHYRSHSGPLFHKYGILNIYDVYVELGVFMYKYYNDLLPKIFKDFFTQRSDIHNYYTRNSENYNHTKNKKVFTDRAVRTTGPILWDSINDLAKNSNSLKHFRQNLKTNYILSYN